MSDARINVSEFCQESNLDEAAVRDVLETIGLSRNAAEIPAEYVNVIVAHIAQLNGKQAALPPANMPEEKQLEIRDAVSLVHSVYPEALVLDDITLTGLVASINARKQAEVFTKVHETTFNNELATYRNKHTENLFHVAEASREFDVKNFLQELGCGEVVKHNNHLGNLRKLTQEK